MNLNQILVFVLTSFLMCVLVCMGVGAVAIGMCDLDFEKDEEEFGIPVSCGSEDNSKGRKKRE